MGVLFIYELAAPIESSRIWAQIESQVTLTHGDPGTSNTPLEVVHESALVKLQILCWSGSDTSDFA